MEEPALCFLARRPPAFFIEYGIGIRRLCMVSSQELFFWVCTVVGCVENIKKQLTRLDAPSPVMPTHICAFSHTPYPRDYGEDWFLDVCSRGSTSVRSSPCSECPVSCLSRVTSSTADPKSLGAWFPSLGVSSYRCWKRRGLGGVMCRRARRMGIETAMMVTALSAVPKINRFTLSASVMSTFTVVIYV